VGQNEISAWFSCLSGLEKVSVNSKLISTHRNLKTDSSHYFKIDEKQYQTRLMVESIWKGPYVCSLYQNDELIKKNTLKIEIIKYSIIERLKLLILPATLGGVFGLASSLYDMPRSSLPAFIIVIVILSMIVNRRSYFTTEFEENI
jgi:hypothetical protein